MLKCSRKKIKFVYDLLLKTTFLIACFALCNGSLLGMFDRFNKQEITEAKKLVNSSKNELSKKLLALVEEQNNSTLPDRFYCCTCPQVTLFTRLTLVSTLLDELIKKYDPRTTSEIVHIDFGETGCLQSYLLAYAMLSTGYKKVSFYLFNTEKNINEFNLDKKAADLNKCLQDTFPDATFKAVFLPSDQYSDEEIFYTKNKDHSVTSKPNPDFNPALTRYNAQSFVSVDLLWPTKKSITWMNEIKKAHTPAPKKDSCFYTEWDKKNAARTFANIIFYTCIQNDDPLIFNVIQDRIALLKISWPQKDSPYLFIEEMATI